MNNPIIPHYPSLSQKKDNETESNLSLFFENMRGLDSIINNIIIIIPLSQKETTPSIIPCSYLPGDNGHNGIMTLILQTINSIIPPLSHYPSSTLRKMSSLKSRGVV
jgi:hypothetical protein